MTDKQTIVDVASGTVTYRAEAELGRATTDHKWAVSRATINGNVTTTEFPLGADGSPTNAEEFAVSDRAVLTYSLTDVLTPPTLSVVTIASDNSDTTKAKVGDTVTLTIESASYLRTPVVTIAGSAATVAMVADQKHWTAAYEMQSTDTAGAVAFSIAFSNVGGREGVSVSATTNSSAVTFDKVAPTATVTMASNNATPTLAKVGDVITITIATSEDALTPVVTISGGSAVVTGSAKAWTATRTVAGGDTAGAIPFVLNFTDTSYNPAAQITAVTSGSAVVLDKVAPTLASAVRGSDTQVTVTISELAKASTITKANAGGFVVSETGTPATTYAVSAIAPGATNDKVVLTVANMDASRTAGVTVTYAAGGNGTVADPTGNVLATDATGVVIAGW